MVVSGFFGTVLHLFLAGGLLRAFRSKSSDVSMTWSMHGLCVTSILSSCVVCIGAWTWRTTWIFSFLHRAKTMENCQIGYIASSIAYALSKMTLYTLLVNRLQVVFEESAYAINKRILISFRVYIWIASIVMESLYLVNIDVRDCMTKTWHIYFCTPKSTTKNRIMWILFPLSDIFTTFVLLLLFLQRMRQVIEPLLKDPASFEKGSHLYSACNRAVVLTFVSSFSTLTFVLIGTLLWYDLSFFLPIECSIHSICVFCLFKFGDSLYDRCCLPCSRLYYFINGGHLNHRIFAFNIDSAALHSPNV
ncbi:hypothetical protein RFI_25388 [Reticulomyxa filosa]|uniref:G-protein coupled receptors family 1 profile domain-containing protein n=1 Tax=Reticulomyxa filosa TaxID=46433 RepID=X6MDN7_RETFI|nr:hypothetical protein RFI_25388 [Reticulomyxa filosa]|eukprot:ETO11989.1 hypothetical protein RFI_25388 [Reticulomyxa filosa]